MRIHIEQGKSLKMLLFRLIITRAREYYYFDHHGQNKFPFMYKLYFGVFIKESNDLITNLLDTH